MRRRNRVRRLRFPRHLTLFFALGGCCFAQKHEIGLGLGAIDGTARQAPSGKINTSAGTALQANYGYRFWRNEKMALLAEVHLLANPQRQVESSNTSTTRDVASLFVTPGLRLKFFPRSPVSPYVVGGGGFAIFEQSLTTIN